MSEIKSFFERQLAARAPELVDQPIFPLALLFMLNLVDEFDVRAFSTLAPEIRDAFNLSNTGFGVLFAFTTVLVLLTGLPIGFVGDRLPRVRLVALAALLWSMMSVLTGLATVLAVLLIARLGSGMGRVFNETIHTSLLTDYYPQHIHGRVFAIHRLGNPVGFLISPLLAGAIANAYGNWRPAFFFAIIPTIIVAGFILRLKEPVRGVTEDAELATEASKEEPLPLSQGFRWLVGIPTLRRLYVSAFFGGGAIFALLAFLSIYFDDVWGVAELGRGYINSGNGLFQLVGTLAGGYLADRLRKFGLGRIAFLAAMSVAGIGLGVLLMGPAPTLGFAVVASWLAYLSIGLWTSPNVSVLAVVLPARVRALGIGVGVMYFGVGGFVFTITAGILVDGPGIRTAIIALAPFLFVASAFYVSASRYANRDGQRALQALALEVELRQQRLEAGEQALLVCRDVDVDYDGVQVLFGVDFEVQQGEIVALLGTNGAGKSTLLKAISGVVHPRAGAIFFEGENVSFLEPHETAAAGIIQVPGGRGIFPSLTVRENIETAAWLYRNDPAHVEAARREVLEIFPVLAERWDEKAGDLSGGEQQMVTLAQAFIAKPKLLMIDELTLGLAPILVEQLLDAVRAIHARGATIILVEQSVNLALTVAHRAYFMEKGEIRFSGPASELAGRRDLVRSVFLEGAAQGKRRKTSRNIGSRPEGDMQFDAVLQTRGLSKSFGGIQAVSDVDLVLRRGEILGVIGPNGAGKTTVFDLISGFLEPDSGRIELLGQDVTDLPPDLRSALGLGRSFQDARLFPSLTVAEAISVALDRHLEVREPVAAALGLPAARDAERKAHGQVEGIISALGLEAFRDKFVSELSTGSRRIVDIACSLAHRPEVLILDEPSSGIAQAETEALGPLLRQVRDDLGCSLLVIEHDIPLVREVSDRLMALDLGSVIAEGEPAKVIGDSRVVEAYLGTSEAAIARSGDSVKKRPTKKIRKGSRARKPRKGDNRPGG